MKRTALEQGAPLTVDHWGGVKWMAPVRVLFQRELKSGLIQVVVDEGCDEGQQRSVSWAQCSPPTPPTRP